jgi:hypothetical protein
MISLPEKISLLSELWGKCLVDYHKSRDTFHYINIQYSFGGVSYRVEHYGYVASTYEQTFNTLKAAQLYLVEQLQNQIYETATTTKYECESDNYDPLSHKTVQYWDNILTTLTEIKGKPVNENLDEVNRIEQLNNTERLYHLLEYQEKEAHAILDKAGIPRYDIHNLDLAYSISYRVELLHQKKKTSTSKS